MFFQEHGTAKIRQIKTTKTFEQDRNTQSGEKAQEKPEH